MKVVVLTGPGIIAKRDYLLKIKQKFTHETITVIDLKSDTLEKLSSSLVSLSLFSSSNKRLVIIENAPESLELDKYESSDPDLGIVLLVDHLKATSKLAVSLKKLNATITPFEGEKELSAFPFVDALLEGKFPTAFIELDKLLKEYGGIYILSMIFYGLRRNLLPLPPSSFMKNKILTQKKNFKDSDWAKLYKITLETDWKLKTGQLSEELGLGLLLERFREISLKQ